MTGEPRRGRRWQALRRSAAVTVVTLVAALAGVVQGSRPAAATAGINLVQKGTEASGGGSSVVATLPAASTANDLLVALTIDLNSGCASDSYSAPAGWVAAATICRGSTGPLILWYRAGAPAGTTSVTFNTGSSGANSLAQLSEWSGVATSNPLDRIGTVYSSSSSSTLAVTTTGNVSASGELAITGFDTSSGLSSFTPGSGWTSVRSDPGSGFDSDYKTSPPTGTTLTESVTSNPQTSWAGVIATFKAGCSGGSTTIQAAPTLSFPSVALTGYDRTVTQTATVTLDDETGSGSGWNLTATSTTFDAGGGHLLPSTATTVTGASVAADAGNCSVPTNAITYPLTLPAGATAPSAVKVYDAAAGTGQGPSDVTLTAVVSVPAKAAAGTYTSTWTLTVGSGP